MATSFVAVSRSLTARPVRLVPSSLNSKVYFCVPIWESNYAFHFPATLFCAWVLPTNASANAASPNVLMMFFMD